MLPWLQKRLSKKAVLLSKLVCFTTGMHVLVFISSIAIYYLRSETKLIINSAQRLYKSDATVVVLPFQKQVKQAVAIIKEKTIQQPSSKKYKAPTKLVQTKPKLQPKVVKKITPIKKTVIKKVESKPAVKKVAKRSNPSTSSQSSRKASTSTAGRSVEKKKKSVHGEPVESIRTVKKTELPALKMAQEQVDSIDKSVVYIGRHDAQLLKVHEQIVEEIHKHWRPPVGIDRDCVCELKVSVNGSGLVTKVAIERPSGVLVYDISARSAVLAMTIPRWGWGKELMIAFNQ